MKPWIVLICGLLVSGCLIAKRDNPCDPSGDFDKELCRPLCAQTQCGADASPIVSTTEGCRCLSCDEIQCEADEYATDCTCLPLNVVEPCTGECMCQPEFANCNNEPMDGCEADTRSSPTHCGMCGYSCEGADCIEGRCAGRLIADDFNFSLYEYAIADEEAVYFADGGEFRVDQDGAVWRMGFDGGERSTYFSGQSDEFYGLTVDDTYLYFCHATIPANIVRVTKAGGSPSSILLLNRSGQPATKCVGEQRMAVTNNLLAYWIFQSGGAYELWSMPKSGGVGNVTVLAMASQSPTSPGPLASDSTSIYYQPGGGDTSLYRYDGNTTTTVATFADQMNRMVIVDQTVFIVGDSGLFSVPVSGGTPQMLGVGGDDGLYVDSTHIYWAPEDSLARYDRATHEVVSLGLEGVDTLAGNSKYLFVGQSLGGGKKDLIWRYIK